ncbi:MAG: response regulator [Ruthenibacterium lactatiformans]
MYRLLIADDEESIREGVADFVRQNCPEWDVAALARDGREALALAREILPDAVLTDITMPHMNGLEFLESLSDLLPEAKLLVLSGYDQFEYAVQALRLGVSDYLLKPLDTAKLVSALSRFAAELDAQALRWAQIETLRTNTQKTNELELQSYFRAALLGEELPALCGKRRVCARGDKLLLRTVRRPGRTARSLERVLEQRLYGAVRTVLLRLGTPPRQAVVFCAPARHAQGCFSR